MKTTTVRDLRYDFPKVEAWLEGGEETVENPVLKHPDYEARRKWIWGDRFFTQAEVEKMRAFETEEP